MSGQGEGGSRGFGRGGDRGGRRGDRRGRRGDRRGGRDAPGEGPWIPVTKLGRLVKEKLIKRIEEIFLFSLPIKETQIVDWFLPAPKLKDEVMKIMPVQKQTSAGQRTRFKAFVIVGDEDGHIGLGVKCASEVANAIRGAINAAKLSIIPVRRGYWGNKIGSPHTVPAKVTGKCGSVRLRLVPAPRGTGLVAAPTTKKVLQYAGYEDCYTSSVGTTRTQGNFIKACFAAISRTYGFLTPDLWKEARLLKTPQQEFTYFLFQSQKDNQPKRIAQE